MGSATIAEIFCPGASYGHLRAPIENRLSELEGVVGTVVTSTSPLRPLLTRVRDVELTLASRSS